MSCPFTPVLVQLSPINGKHLTIVLQVRADQLRHVQNGCLSRKLCSLRADGSRIEGSHRHWNNLQRAYSSGIVVMQALAHDFVLRRNIRIGHTTCDDDNLSPPNLFLKSTYGSHHIHLVTRTAALWNALIGKKHVKATSQIPRPELQVIHSGEAFGIAASDHATTLGGLVEIKEEPHNPDGLWDFLAEDDDDSDLDIDPILQDLDIDPMLLQISHHSTKGTTKDNVAGDATPATSTGSKRKPDCTDRDVIPSKRPRIQVGGDHPRTSEDNVRYLTLPGLITLLTVIVEAVIASPPRSLSLSGNTGNAAESAVPSALVTADSVTRPSDPCTFFTTSQQLDPSRSDSSIHGTPTGAFEKSKSGSASISSLSQRLPPPVRSMAGLTRSQSLFSIFTGVDARALAINGSDEFFLFMDLRAEQRWVSYNMNSRKWLVATNEFNSRLEALNTLEGIGHIPKHPRTLMEQLGNVETKIATRIACNNLTCGYICHLHLIVRWHQEFLTHLDSRWRRLAPTHSGGNIALSSRP